MDAKPLCRRVVNIGLPVPFHVDDRFELLCPIQTGGIHRGLADDDGYLLQMFFDDAIWHPGTIVFNDMDPIKQLALGICCKDHFLGSWKRVDQNQRELLHGGF